jgi:hypothetical protein
MGGNYYWSMMVVIQGNSFDLRGCLAYTNRTTTAKSALVFDSSYSTLQVGHDRETGRKKHSCRFQMHTDVPLGVHADRFD